MYQDHIIDSKEVQAAITRIAKSIAERHRDTASLAIVSVANGGIEFGHRIIRHLETTLGRTLNSGILDISFHRDDFVQKPIPKHFLSTELSFPVDDACVILVDDVLFSGRTVRAALNELFDQGRPERVELAVLCDRGNRRLPLQADYTGLTLQTHPDETVHVHLDANEPTLDRITLKPA